MLNGYTNTQHTISAYMWIKQKYHNQWKSSIDWECWHIIPHYMDNWMSIIEKFVSLHGVLLWCVGLAWFTFALICNHRIIVWCNDFSAWKFISHAVIVTHRTDGKTSSILLIGKVNVTHLKTVLFQNHYKYGLSAIENEQLHLLRNIQTMKHQEPDSIATELFTQRKHNSWLKCAQTRFDALKFTAMWLIERLPIDVFHRVNKPFII